jgi:hypothetical protein
MLFRTRSQDPRPSGWSPCLGIDRELTATSARRVKPVPGGHGQSMSDSSGGTPPVHPYPGEDRPACPRAAADGLPEAGSPAPGLTETQPSAADEAALPSEQQGRS